VIAPRDPAALNPLRIHTQLAVALPEPAPGEG